MDTLLEINTAQIRSQVAIAKINAELAPATSIDTEARLGAHLPPTSPKRWRIWKSNAFVPEEVDRLWIGKRSCYGFVGAVAQRHSIEIVSSCNKSITFTVPNNSKDKNMLHVMQSVLNHRAKITALTKYAGIPDFVTLFGIINRHLTEDDCFDESDFDWIYK